MATDSSDSSRCPCAPVNGRPRPPEDVRIATDGVPDVISDGGSVVSLSSSLTALPA